MIRTSIRRTRGPLVVAGLVVLSALVAVPALRDAATHQPFPPATLHHPPGYLIGAPLFGLWDTLSLLTVSQHYAVLATLIVLYAAGRLAAACASRSESRTSADHPDSVRRSGSPTAPRRSPTARHPAPRSPPPRPGSPLRRRRPRRPARLLRGGRSHPASHGRDPAGRVRPRRGGLPFTHQPLPRRLVPLHGGPQPGMARSRRLPRGLRHRPLHLGGRGRGPAREPPARRRPHGAAQRHGGAAAQPSHQHPRRAGAVSLRAGQHPAPPRPGLDRRRAPPRRGSPDHALHDPRPARPDRPARARLPGRRDRRRAQRRRAARPRAGPFTARRDPRPGRLHGSGGGGGRQPPRMGTHRRGLERDAAPRLARNVAGRTGPRDRGHPAPGTAPGGHGGRTPDAVPRGVGDQAGGHRPAAAMVALQHPYTPGTRVLAGLVRDLGRRKSRARPPRPRRHPPRPRREPTDP